MMYFLEVTRGMGLPWGGGRFRIANLTSDVNYRGTTGQLLADWELRSKTAIFLTVRQGLVVN